MALVATGICAAATAPGGRLATVAYTRVSGGVPHIWTINVDTQVRRQLTRGRYGEETPSWSPAGRRLVYAATRMHHVPGLAAPQIAPVLMIQNLSSATTRAITTGRDLDETPAWSPRGDRIAFVRTLIPTGSRTGPPEEIWTIGASGRDARQLTHNSLSDIAPAWSPTARWLVYERARDSSLRSWDLWTMRANGSGQRLLVRNGTRPAWSPNGQLIAYGQPPLRLAAAAWLRTSW
jgi:TolB protein